MLYKAFKEEYIFYLIHCAQWVLYCTIFGVTRSVRRTLYPFWCTCTRQEVGCKTSSVHGTSIGAFCTLFKISWGSLRCTLYTFQCFLYTVDNGLKQLLAYIVQCLLPSVHCKKLVVVAFGVRTLQKIGRKLISPCR